MRKNECIYEDEGFYFYFLRTSVGVNFLERNKVYMENYYRYVGALLCNSLTAVSVSARYFGFFELSVRK